MPSLRMTPSGGWYRGDARAAQASSSARSIARRMSRAASGLLPAERGSFLTGEDQGEVAQGLVERRRALQGSLREGALEPLDDQAGGVDRVALASDEAANLRARLVRGRCRRGTR